MLTMVGSTRTKIARFSGDEGGWTLIELLVGAVISLVVAGAAITLLNVAVRTEPVTSGRAGQIQQGRVMVERISRELRQGESVSGADASGLSIITYVNSASCGGASSSAAILCRVTYACSGTACTRTERNPDGSGTAAPAEAVSGLLDANVFSYQPAAADPSYVGIRLAFPADAGDEAVTLEDGVALRNSDGA